MFEELDDVLLLKNETQLLSYDTTFELGDFYVPILIFRHMLFKEQPCIPCAFLIHERKLTETHEDLFDVLSRQVKSITKLSIPLVTDGEKALINSIESKLPIIILVRCWNHIITSMIETHS